MSENEANWVNLVGLDRHIQQVIDAWPNLVDTDDLRGTPAPRLLPLTPAMSAVLDAGNDVLRVGIVEIARDKSEALMSRLQQEIPAQLGLGDEDVSLIPGFYLKPAGGEE